MTTKLLVTMLLAAGTGLAQPRISIGVSIGGPAYYGGYYLPPPPVPAYAYYVPAAPGPAYVWMPGHYYVAGSAYRWRAGAWVRPPHRKARWVAPYYRGGRYYAGYWR
jgi:hypothetical protein